MRAAILILILHSPFSTLHMPQRGVTPFSMEKLSYWLLFFLILHSPRRCDNPYYNTTLHDQTFWFKTPSFIRLRYSIIRHIESMLCHIKEVILMESNYSPPSINVTLINVNSLYLLTKSYSPHIAN
jgi:hypothetical protein